MTPSLLSLLDQYHQSDTHQRKTHMVWSHQSLEWSDNAQRRIPHSVLALQTNRQTQYIPEALVREVMQTGSEYTSPVQKKNINFYCAQHLQYLFTYLISSYITTTVIPTGHDCLVHSIWLRAFFCYKEFSGSINKRIKHRMKRYTTYRVKIDFYNVIFWNNQ